jgi:hypothetical protein
MADGGSHEHAVVTLVKSNLGGNILSEVRLHWKSLVAELILNDAYNRRLNCFRPMACDNTTLRHRFSSLRKLP